MSDIQIITGSNVPVPLNLVGLTGQEVQALVEKEALDQLRWYRDKKLQETDWTQLPDVPEDTRTKWQTYRQELRDITITYSSIQGIVWPTKPE